MKSDLELFDFHFIDTKSSQTLILLHGTGADKYDLVPIGEKVAPLYNLLSLSGNVFEHGMRRFFARFSVGVFDMKSIREETEKLSRFISAWKEHSGNQELSWLGYSNGATMIVALLFSNPALIEKAVLLHPMLPYEPEKLLLLGKQFLVSYGENDLMIPAAKSLDVVQLLRLYEATVQTVSHEGGHEVQMIELEKTAAFLRAQTAVEL